MLDNMKPRSGYFIPEGYFARLYECPDYRLEFLQVIRTIVKNIAETKEFAIEARTVLHILDSDGYALKSANHIFPFRYIRRMATGTCNLRSPGERQRFPMLYYL